jgi:hypothetical protein
MQTLWHIQIDDTHAEILNRKIFGLTFPERPLFEGNLPEFSKSLKAANP